MNNISLTQVSTFVVAVSMGSFFVSADDDIVQASAKSSVAQETMVATKDAVKAVGESDKFTFTSLDVDKNGKLSQQEVIAGKNKWLADSFKKIDGNADESLTEQELVDFVAKTSASSK